MRVLYLLPALQHPTQRGALRHYHFLKEIAARHEVTLLVLTKEDPSPDAYAWAQDTVERLRLFPVDAAETDGAALRRGSFRWLTWRARKALRLRRARLRMRRVFRDEAHPDRHDVVLFHGKEIFAVVDGFDDLPLIADICDATSVRLRGQIPHARGLERPWAVMAWLRAWRADQKLIRQTSHRVFISARDRNALLPEGAPARIISNGIDLEYWTPSGKSRRPARIVLTGVMDYPPNEDGALWLLEEILPRVRKHVPGTEVVIAGRSPTARIRNAAERMQGAEVTGFVEDLRPYLDESTVFTASIRFASGLQNKVLEALAMEVPVVATPEVAAGVRVSEGGYGPAGDRGTDGGRMAAEARMTDEGTLPLRVAGDADGFACETVEMLKSAERRRALAERGRRYVEQHFNWSEAAALLERTCREAVGTNRDHRGIHDPVR